VPCRVTTEAPENGFTPDYGRLTAYRSADGFGLRLDGGTAYTGAVITPFYDSLLVKVTAWGHAADEAIARMDRALREFRIRGVSTNLQFLENVIAHPQFRSGECITRFIDETPDGDMALFMVANDLSRADVEAPAREIAFPDSVVSLFRGELGYPPDGFPPALQAKVLKGRQPLPGRAGDSLPPVDFDARRDELAGILDRPPGETELSSYLMYLKVFSDYVEHQRRYGDVSLLPTPAFFHGLRDREEIAVGIDRGKTLLIRQTGRSETVDDEGRVKVFFELNGQPRMIRIERAGAEVRRRHPRIEDGNPAHVGAPMPGAVVTVSVRAGQKVRKGNPLVSIDAMKMETQITADRDAVVARVLVAPGDRIEAKDLLVELG